MADSADLRSVREGQLGGGGSAKEAKRGAGGLVGRHRLEQLDVGVAVRRALGVLMCWGGWNFARESR